MKKFDETFFPEFVTDQEKQMLGQVAAHAERLSSHDLEKLIFTVQQIQEVAQTAQREEAEKAALEAHYRREAQREIAQAAHAADVERRVRRVRVARALGIPEDSPELDGLK